MIFQQIMIAQGFFWFFDITSKSCLNMYLKLLYLELLNLAQPAAKDQEA
jgi:hypothetical protein